MTGPFDGTTVQGSNARKYAVAEVGDEKVIVLRDQPRPSLPMLLRAPRLKLTSPLRTLFPLRRIVWL